VEPVSTEGFVLSVEGYLLFFLFKIKINFFVESFYDFLGTCPGDIFELQGLYDMVMVEGFAGNRWTDHVLGSVMASLTKGDFQIILK